MPGYLQQHGRRCLLTLVAVFRRTYGHKHTHKQTDFTLKALKGKDMNLDFGSPASQTDHIFIKADVKEVNKYSRVDYVHASY